MLMRQITTQALQKIWYGQHWSARLASHLLYPLSILFCVVSQSRRNRYSQQQVAQDIPVIVVGNLTVGGTGKTPLSIYLLRCLQQAGYQPGIVSLGYGGSFSQTQDAAVMQVRPDSDPAIAGDEAVLMAQRTQRPVVIGRNRIQAIHLLKNTLGCDVVVADDGLQHYRMARDIEIAVVDGQRHFGNAKLLPAGPLREPVSRLDACDFIVVNGGSTEPDEANSFNLSNLSSLSRRGHQYHMHMSGERLYALDDKKSQTLSALAGCHVNVVTALGNPQRFLTTLQQAGLVLNTVLFPDHHLFKESAVCFDNDDPVLMTEKDAVKCRQFSTEIRRNLWYLPIDAQLESGFSTNFLQAVLLIANRKKHEQTIA